MGLDAGFLSMLTMRMSWEAHTGTDTWGNETWAVPVPDVPCFVSSQVTEFGRDAGNNVQENVRVTRVEVIADAMGIKIKDRLTIPGGQVVHVTDVDTPKDEQGNDLLHTIQATSTQKG